MQYFNIIFTLSIFAVCLVDKTLSEIPSYIHLCKRDQSTIDECVHKSIIDLKPKLIEGIPELNVPPIEPFYIPRLILDYSELANFKAEGKDVKVTGLGNFTIKKIHVDLDTFKIKSSVHFPKLHFLGKYKLDGQILALPIKGQGKLIADAIKCDAEMDVHSQVVQRGGVDYLQFNKIDVDIRIHDYRIRLEGLFNGDKALGDATNEAINQNRREFLMAAKPYAEKTISMLLLDVANNIAGSFPLDELLPKS